jgi:hypothetical protein
MQRVVFLLLLLNFVYIFSIDPLHINGAVHIPA